MKMSRELTKTPILKRVGQALKKAVITLMAIGVLVFGGLGVKGYIESQQYIPTQVISQNLEEFSVESPYVFRDIVTNSYKRLAHNNGEPIYVAFTDDYDEYPELKQYAIESLDYLFGIVGAINPLYSYKIVSQSELAKQNLLGKSTIKYEITEFHAFIQGRIIMNVDAHDLAYWDFVCSSNTIQLDPKMRSSKTSFEEFKYVCIHELMHALGFADIYHVDGPEFLIRIYERINGSDRFEMKEFHSDTFMGDNEFHDRITPKDFETLCALYMPVDADEAKMQEVKTMIAQYREAYNQALDQEYFSRFTEMTKIDETKIACPSDEITEIRCRYGDEFSFANSYKITITGDRYHIEIYDNSMNLVDQADGDIATTEHFKILTNCNFQKGFIPMSRSSSCEDGCIENIVIFDDGEEINVFPQLERSFPIVTKVVYQSEKGM